MAQISKTFKKCCNGCCGCCPGRKMPRQLFPTFTGECACLNGLNLPLSCTPGGLNACDEDDITNITNAICGTWFLPTHTATDCTWNDGSGTGGDTKCFVDFSVQCGPVTKTCKDFFFNLTLFVSNQRLFGNQFRTAMQASVTAPNVCTCSPLRLQWNNVVLGTTFNSPADCCAKILFPPPKTYLINVLLQE